MVELNQNELMNVNGGGGITGSLEGWVIGEVFTRIVKELKEIPTKPYETTVTRQGKKYTVKYDGKPW